MDNQFFEKPILNSPYEYPTRHWELDEQGQPTQQIIRNRRSAEFITPIPKPRKRKRAADQQQMVFDEGKGLSTQDQQYDPTTIINELRQHVDRWRSLPNPNDWQVTPETARLWISGLEIVKRKLGLSRVMDLSATPFFLRGSGYAEGTLFHWTMSDFSLMDAIECGIVKLPRVPVADNIPGSDMPMYRNLWEHIRTHMPKKGRGKAKTLDPLSLPVELQTALEALYGHYEKTYKLWKEAGINVPPCFIVVCNNTSTSKLVYDYISGFHRENEDGSTKLENGRLELFRNFDEHGNQLGRPLTLLIDSEQLESGDALDKNFRNMAVDEIERFRREDAKDKKSTMETYWVPGVNNHGQYGRWAFAEFTEVYQIEADFEKKVEAEFNNMIDSIMNAEK